MSRNNEQTPLLQERWSEEGENRTVITDLVSHVSANSDSADLEQLLRIEDLPSEYNPREWSRWNKMANVVVIACMSSPYPHATSLLLADDCQS